MIMLGPILQKKEQSTSSNHSNGLFFSVTLIIHLTSRQVTSTFSTAEEALRQKKKFETDVEFQVAVNNLFHSQKNCRILSSWN